MTDRKKVKPFPVHKLNRRKKGDKEPSKASTQLGKVLGTILVASIAIAASSALITVSIFLWKWALGL